MTNILAFVVLASVPLAPWLIVAAFILFGRKS